MTEYKKLQIVKHALQRYIERPGATAKEIEEEKKLLKYYIEKVENLKEKYGLN